MTAQELEVRSLYHFKTLKTENLIMALRRGDIKTELKAPVVKDAKCDRLTLILYITARFVHLFHFNLTTEPKL